MSSTNARRGRTMAEIAARYDDRRERILNAIRHGKMSASMSGIEYYPKPWAELDMADDSDLVIISGTLTWDGEEHDCDGIERRSPEILQLHRQVMCLYSEPTGLEREAEITAVRDKIAAIKKRHDRHRPE